MDEWLKRVYEELLRSKISNMEDLIFSIIPPKNKKNLMSWRIHNFLYHLLLVASVSCYTIQIHPRPGILQFTPYLSSKKRCGETFKHGQ